MKYDWRDFVGLLVDGKYPLVEFLEEATGAGVFASEPVNSHPSLVRLAPGGTKEATATLERWRALTALNHPNITGIYAAGETEVLGHTIIYMVTERPDDRLADAVESRSLTEEEARPLATALLGGLAYLHQKGFAHGAVQPDNIVAMGDLIKLTPWTIARATPQQVSEDIFAAGQTIAEVLTQRRPTGEATLPRLPEPFSDCARACLRKTVDAGEALRMLTATPDVVAPLTPKYKLPTVAVVIASLAVLGLVYGVRSYQSRDHSPTPATTTIPPAETRAETAVRDSPAAATPTSRAQEAAPEALPASAPSRGDWVVVAEIYKQHNQATNRAREIAARWKQWQPEVYPPKPGARRYMVVLAFAETRKGAEQALARARADGMPRKVYMTRIKR